MGAALRLWFSESHLLHGEAGAFVRTEIVPVEWIQRQHVNST